jgi:hypothetical protein
MLGGLPVVVGPILLAFALEHGAGFAARAAAGALAGLVSLTAFMVAYAWCARITWWLPALAASWTAFAAATLGLDQVKLPAGLALVAVGAAFALAHVALPRRVEGAPAPPAPRWDLAMRALSTVALVLAITGAARALGPRLSGLLAAFPVLASVLAAFTHLNEGAPAATEFLRGLVTGLVAFAVFCFVLAELLGLAGIAVSFAAASLAAVAVNAPFVLRAAPQRQPA